MMSSDAGGRLPDLPRVDFALPEVLDLRIRPTAFDPPRLNNFDSALPRTADAVEFVVTTAGPIPARALGPALFVGETAVTEVTQIAPDTYRFVALTREGLDIGAPISLGWAGDSPEEVKETRFRFELPSEGATAH
jgi:hypothetical protein